MLGAAITPTTGPVADGTVMNITRTGFVAVTAVALCGTAAKTATPVSATTISVILSDMAKSLLERRVVLKDRPVPRASIYGLYVPRNRTERRVGARSLARSCHLASGCRSV